MVSGNFLKPTINLTTTTEVNRNVRERKLKNNGLAEMSDDLISSSSDAISPCSDYNEENISPFSNTQDRFSTSSEELSPSDTRLKSHNDINENYIYETKFKPNRRFKSASNLSVLQEIPLRRSRSRFCSLSTIGSTSDVSPTSTVSSRLCSALPSARSRSMSRLSCSSLDKASIILSLNAAHLPARDRKILELMVSRYENRLNEDEVKQLAHEQWEMEKKFIDAQNAIEEEARRKALIRDNEQYQKWRKSKQQAMEQQEQNLLREKEQALLIKAEKWHQLAEEQEILRQELLLQRRHESIEKKKAQEFHRLQLEKEREQLNCILTEMKEQSFLKAAQKRQLLKYQRLLEVQLENEESLRRHLKKKAQVDEKFRTDLDQLKELLENKEAQARENYAQILFKRDESVQTQMLEREERFAQLRNIQEKLNHGFKEWQQQLMEYRALVNAKAAVKVQLQLSARLEDLRKERVAKSMHHERIMQEIQQEEKKKLRNLKQKVRFKEVKSELVTRKKNQEINQSRAVAWASAELRDKMNRTLNPETFDQKVQRVEMECRLLRKMPLIRPSD